MLSCLAIGQASVLLPHRPRVILPGRQHRAWKRRRLKAVNVRSLLDSNPSPFEDLFRSLMSQVSSANSLGCIAPTLGLVSGLALFFSSSSSKLFPNTISFENYSSDIGEWILYTSPSPFNRFVTLRCPSMCLPGNEELTGKLVEGDGHSVKLNTGRMIVCNVDDDFDEDMDYQRICIGTDDGGVLSLDWPATLDLEEELGFDTTVFIVPGTTEGSKERRIKIFISECVRRGIFPIVMNPRGCAGSPLTTARLFTAADSDDVFTAMQFVNKKRPLSTLMAVGWGYGANMLTKHLAEYGERTPLTAATCIDNPFELVEANRSYLHKNCDQRLRDGLIKIFQDNKELFRGRGKGFDIERALLASSVQDFDQAISMVSHGLNAIGDFYAKCNTRDVIDRLKVPVLFIQNYDEKVPAFYIPKESIAGNPHTSLLLCKYSQVSDIIDDRLLSTWCQHLALEWLAAVELGLLKGRHPLLGDVDTTISPSKCLSMLDGRASNERGSGDKLLNLDERTAAIPPFEKIPADDVSNKLIRSESSVWKSFSSMKSLQGEANSDDQESSSTVDPVVQAAHVVLNMLDITLPDTLSDDQKKRVLKAVGQGETLLEALHGAVPEEVRGKLKSAVSSILQSHGSDLKLDRIARLGNDVALELNSKVLEKIKQIKVRGSQDASSTEKEMTSDKLLGDTEYMKPSSEIPPEPETAGNQSFSGNSQFEKNLAGSGNALGIASQGSDVNRGCDAEKFRGESEIDKDQIDTVDMENNFPANQDNLSEAYQKGEQSSAAPPDSVAEVSGSEADKNQNKQGFISNGDPPHFSVSQALDALTGLDDSTQVAVNSVFHVIEDMIDKLEGEQDKENQEKSERTVCEVKETVEVKEWESGHLPDDEISPNGFGSKKTVDLQIDGVKADYSDGNPFGGEEIFGYKYEHQQFSQVDYYGNSSNENHLRDQSEVEDDIDLPPGKLYANKPVNSVFEKIISYLATHPHKDPIYNGYLNSYLYMKTGNPKLFATEKSALHLDYFPEEDKWKLLDKSEENGSSIDEDGMNSNSSHSGKHLLQTVEPKEVRILCDNFKLVPLEFEGCKLFIKNSISDCLKVEVSRRIRMAFMEEVGLKLAKEIEFVSSAVSMAAGQGMVRICKENDNQERKRSNLDGNSITETILSALKETQYLRRILPAGVIVGTSLVELRKFFSVSTLGTDDGEGLCLDLINKSEGRPFVSEKDGSERILRNREITDSSSSTVKQDDHSNLESSCNDDVTIGAVSAALGASAFLAHQQNNDIDETSNMSHKEEDKNTEEPSELNEATERLQNNLVTSLAEKAMSVASPMVPVKEDGQLDQDRMVAMLTELGQKGGFLKLFGKVALLWGGIRGAMSLADKLISFLHMAERPLFQRILGFASMVLLLWSPVIIPLLPTLMQSWATKSPFKVAEISGIAGLYVSTIIMITLWGKRVRKYDDSLMQYGLDLTSASELKEIVKGWMGGIALIIFIHTMNSLIGFAHICWPTGGLSFSSASGPAALIRSFGQMVLFTVQGLATAIGVSIVEELLFRSWLPQEIAADFGYHYGIVLSGLSFAVSQRSKWEIPGLWLLSLCLSGIRQRNRGSLSLGIGIRAGIILSNFLLRRVGGGFLTYHHHGPNFPSWVTVGCQPLEPFSGVVGFGLALFLAVILYPRWTLRRKPDRVIRP